MAPWEVHDVFAFTSNNTVRGHLALVPGNAFAPVMVLDTGYGPDCVAEKRLPPRWDEALLSKRSTSIRTADNRVIKTRGFVHLWIYLGEYVACDEFLVCEELPVPVLLGTRFIDRHVRFISSMSQAVELADNTTKAKLVREDNALPGPTPVKELIMPPLRMSRDDYCKENRVRICRQVTLYPGQQTAFHVTTKREGIVVIEPIRSTLSVHGYSASKGVHSVRQLSRSGYM